MTAALRVWWRLRRSGARENRVPDVLAIVAFAVCTAATLVCVGGLGAFRSRDVAGVAGDTGELYAALAVIATGLMLVPILTLGAVAARLAIARRDQRMAALRLASATSTQVATMTLAEAALQAFAGAVAGAVLYAALLAPLRLLTFQGRRMSPGELWVGPLALLGVLLAVVLLSVVSGVFSLAKVVVSPRDLPTLLAARRIVDDPRSTWRAVGATGLGVLIAGLSTLLAGAGGSEGAAETGKAFLGVDIATGSMITLVIIAVVAATSTGVVQAARVIDQRGKYHALALAGTDLRTLHAARTREVAIPLVATLMLSGAFCLLLSLPFASAIGPLLLVRFVLAVGVVAALLLVAVAASRSLVRQACALT